MIDCPHCKSEESLHTEFQTRDGSEWAHCDKCGYYRNVMTLRDRQKTDRVKSRAKACLDKGDEMGAIKECEYTHLLEKWGKEEALSSVKRFLESKSACYLKLNKDGKYIQRCIERGGFGSYRIQTKSCGQVGSLHRDAKKRQQQIKRLQELRMDKDIEKVEIFEFVNGGLEER